MTGDCTVWLADLSRSGDRLAALGLEHAALDRAALDRHAKARGTEAKRDIAASYGLLWRALGEPSDLGARLQRRRSGWISLPNGPGFSLSRTNGWAGIAVAAGGVGLDIEAPSRTAPSLDLLDEIMAAASDRETATARLAAFTSLEAWVKLRGYTLAAVLDNPTMTRAFLVELTGARARRVLHRLDMPGLIIGHLWSERPSAPPRIRLA